LGLVVAGTGSGLIGFGLTGGWAAGSSCAAGTGGALAPVTPAAPTETGEPPESPECDGANAHAPAPTATTAAKATTWASRRARRI
jgi:hypothetical protein